MTTSSSAGEVVAISHLVAPVYDGENYIAWKAKMMTLLQSEGLWSVFEETEKVETNSRANARALSRIQNGVSSTIFPKIMGITKAKDAWEILEKDFEDRKPIDLMKDSVDEIFMATFMCPPEYNPLFQATTKNDPHAMEDFIRQRHSEGDHSLVLILALVRSLHFAVGAGNERMVKKLLQFLDPSDLEISSPFTGRTALHEAAVQGSVKIAILLVQKCPSLPNVPDYKDILPVVLAAKFCHKNALTYLLGVTHNGLTVDETTSDEEERDRRIKTGATIVVLCIHAGFYDTVLSLFQLDKRLALTRDFENRNAVLELAKYAKFHGGRSKVLFWQRWIRQFPFMKHSNAYVYMEDKRLENNALTSIYDFFCREILEQRSEEINKAVFISISHGNAEFISQIIKLRPELLWLMDYNTGRNLFTHTILERQENIYNLLCKVKGGIVKKLSLTIDKSGNSILHLAAMLSPQSQLDRIAGAALQMQRELQWFKEVEKIALPMLKANKNKDGLTPKQVFTKEHENLVIKGEKWMKETATSCTVVAALLVTIMFAAAFTVPGGYDYVTGNRSYLNGNSLVVFLISDAVSLVSSSTSVLVFLGMLTSRYREKDFLKSLPAKLIIGLFTLFFSIATMMVTFVIAIVIMLRARFVWISMPIIMLASVPVTFYAILQFPLLFDIFRSTYGCGISSR